jgi:predicted Rossmann-fold nucleotide-binding protein
MAESLTLIQTGKLHQFPVILVGREYWKGLIDWMTNTMLRVETISEEDLSYFIITDSVEEVLDITKATAGRFNLRLRPRKSAKAA